MFGCEGRITYHIIEVIDGLVTVRKVFLWTKYFYILKFSFDGLCNFYASNRREQDGVKFWLKNINNWN